MNNIALGCVADDFSGASDAASFISAGGLQTVLINGIPESGLQLPDGISAVVAALKTRTQETKSAVEDSLLTLRRLKGMGAKQFYIKYCSTFDSTPQGNIGPICDAAMEELRVPYTLLCPSLPVNGRTVRDGRLYVNGVPLEQTHMRNHPLTPMWDSFVPELMRQQSRYPCFIAGRAHMEPSVDEIEAAVNEYSKIYSHFYLVPDYETDTDAEMLGSLFGKLPLLTGGSGLLGALAKRKAIQTSGSTSSSSHVRSNGKAIIFAGSCSVATQAQVKFYLSNGGHGVMLHPGQLTSGLQTPESVWEELTMWGGDSLVYSAGSMGQLCGDAKEAQLLEETIAKLARMALSSDYTRFIVAGGETSGAVTRSLNWQIFHIGKSIAPGVPLMTPLESPHARLVLKSGNFGQEDFFLRALAASEGV